MLSWILSMFQPTPPVEVVKEEDSDEDEGNTIAYMVIAMDRHHYFTSKFWMHPELIEDEAHRQAFAHLFYSLNTGATINHLSTSLTDYCTTDLKNLPFLQKLRSDIGKICAEADRQKAKHKASPVIKPTDVFKMKGQ